jgi:hypothetical protein
MFVMNTRVLARSLHVRVLNEVQMERTRLDGRLQIVWNPID